MMNLTICLLVVLVVVVGEKKNFGGSEALVTDQIDIHLAISASSDSLTRASSSSNG